MPIYEFQCKKCNEVSDFNLKLSDPNPAECPHCGGAELQKLISSSSFALKGGGWYSDLYGSSQPKPKKKSTSSDAKPADTPSTSKKTASPKKSSSTPEK